MFELSIPSQITELPAAYSTLTSFFKFHEKYGNFAGIAWRVTPPHIKCRMIEDAFRNVDETHRAEPDQDFYDALASYYSSSLQGVLPLKEDFLRYTNAVRFTDDLDP